MPRGPRTKSEGDIESKRGYTHEELTSLGYELVGTIPLRRVIHRDYSEGVVYSRKIKEIGLFIRNGNLLSLMDYHDLTTGMSSGVIGEITWERK